MSAEDSTDLARFRAAISRHLGLVFDESKQQLLAEMLARRLGARGQEASTYLGLLEGEGTPTRRELAELARDLTVGETYFFRHIEQFRAFVERALPARLAAREARPLRILSAGCSSGEEPYSLAISLQGRVDASVPVSIHAVDLNPAVIERARRGRYTAWSLRETPAEVQRRWFRSDGREFTIEPRIAAAVVFEERNLAEIGAETWPLASFDVIFCRNVLMYFSPEVASRVVSVFAHALAPGGYLFLGHAETLRGLSHDYHLCHSHDTFYYQRKRGPLSMESTASGGPLAATGRDAQPAFELDRAWADDWVEAVQRASERIKDLTARHERPSALSPAARDAERDIELATEHLRDERYGDALALLAGLAPEARSEPRVALLRAALLTHQGDLAAAESACAELLEIDELSAFAHYLLALCREGKGDPKGAMEHCQTAAYLDAGFAMPHLHLGLLARRSGDRETAQRELARAKNLLEHEEPARLLLFGGGFSREGLLALCRAELDRVGGRA